ncbi:MAG: hypothetical protein LBB74_03110 [Chitinispirillales bacterium]|nr:hypothetical protein [Chitinispirillales bacterium]
MLSLPAPSVAYEPKNKPAVAVYVTGYATDEDRKTIGASLLAALVNSGNCVGDENSAAFLAAAEEESRLRQDPLDDGGISELGRRFGIRYVCAASIAYAPPGVFTLSARVIGTKTGTARFNGEASGPIASMEDLTRLVDALVGSMFGGRGPDAQTEPAVPEPPAPSPPALPWQEGKRIVAVYMAGEEPRGARGVHNIVGGELARVMSESDKYTAVDRTETILEQLDREHVYQRSGAVDDAQIKAIGHQLGVEYLCISNINAVGKKYYLDTRLVDVVTAEIARSVTATSSLKDANEMTRAGREIALELLEADKTRTQRVRRKKIFRYTAIGLDVLGAGALAYGIMENGNVVKNKKSVTNVNAPKNAGRVDEGYIKNGPEAGRAATRRNAAYIAGGAFIAAGVSVHIVF